MCVHVCVPVCGGWRAGIELCEKGRMKAAASFHCILLSLLSSFSFLRINLGSFFFPPFLLFYVVPPLCCPPPPPLRTLLIQNVYESAFPVSRELMTSPLLRVSPSLLFISPSPSPSPSPALGPADGWRSWFVDKRNLYSLCHFSPPPG